MDFLRAEQVDRLGVGRPHRADVLLLRDEELLHLDEVRIAEVVRVAELLHVERGGEDHLERIVAPRHPATGGILEEDAPAVDLGQVLLVVDDRVVAPQIVEGVEASVVHRPLRPANVIVEVVDVGDLALVDREDHAVPGQLLDEGMLEREEVELLGGARVDPRDRLGVGDRELDLQIDVVLLLERLPVLVSCGHGIAVDAQGPGQRLPQRRVHGAPRPQDAATHQRRGGQASSAERRHEVPPSARDLFSRHGCPSRESRQRSRPRSNSPAITRANEAATMSVAMALSSGLTIEPSVDQIWMGSVLSLPIVNSVRMNSSNDSVKAKSALPTMPGRMSGKVTCLNVVISSAPRSMAASSSDSSNRCSRVEMRTNT